MEQQYCAYDGYPILGGVCNACLRRSIKAAEERQLNKRREQERKAALQRQKEDSQKQKETQEKAKRQEKKLLKEQEGLSKKQNNKPGKTVVNSGKPSGAKNFISCIFGLFAGYLSFKAGFYNWDLQLIPLANSDVDAIVGFFIGIILAQLSSTIRKITWGLMLIGLAYIGYSIM